MNSSDCTTNSSFHSHSLPQSSLPLNTPIVISPCAACKILRRRCAEKCILAPYFPPTEPLKFTTAHRLFGASNIIKMLQELPEPHRADAVNSMVYEANARIRDPVYGTAGTICQLHKQVNELHAQLAKAQAEMINVQLQQASLLEMICSETQSAKAQPSLDGFLNSPQRFVSDFGYLEDGTLGLEWEPSGHEYENMNQTYIEMEKICKLRQPNGR